MKILVAEDDNDLREIITFIIENEFHAQVLQSGDGLDAIDKIKNEDFDLILSDFNMPKKNGDDIYKAARVKNPNLPFVLISTAATEKQKQYKTDPYYGAIDKPFTNQQITTCIKKYVNKSPSAVKDTTDKEISARTQDFISVPVQILYKLEKLEIPLYIQISNNKFVKVIHAGVEITDSEKERLKTKQINRLWIEKIHYSVFINDYQRKVLSKIFWNSLSEDNSTIELAENHEVIHNAAKVFGWSPDVIEMANKTIKQTLQFVSKNPSLSNVIKNISSKENIRLSTHCVLLAIACTACAKKLGWTSDMTIEKLVFASMVHDMELDEDFYANKKTLLKLANPSEMKNDQEDRKLIEHPLKAAEILALWPLCPPDVDTIVRQHHESPDGKGFPLGINYQRISPLSAIFIIAEDLMYNSIDNTDNDPLKYILSRTEFYSHGEFKKIHQAFVEMMS